MKRARRGWVVATALAALSMSLQIASAYAAEWSATPSVHSQFFYDDNYQLHTVTKNSVNGWLLEPRVVLARQTETTNLRLNGGLQFWRYPGNASLNTNNRDLTLSGSYARERSRWGLTAGVVRDTTVTNTTTDAGLVQTAYARHEDFLTPSWSWLPNERSRLDVSLNDTRVSYNAPLTQFSNYKYLQLNSTWTWNYSARTQLQLGVIGSQYKAPASSLRSNSWNLQAGVIEQFSERFSGSFNVGRVVTFTSQDGTALTAVDYNCLQTQGFVRACFTFGPIHHHSRASGLTIAAALTWKDQLDTYQLKLNRAVTPTGLGQLTESDTLQATVNRRLREHLSASLSLYGLRSRALKNAQTATTFTNRTYVAVSPGVNWAPTRYWRFRASYQLRRQKLDQEPAAKANEIQLSVRYTWPKFAMSR